MDRSFEGFEREAAVLESIARQYGADSPEGAVIRRAALALLFVALNHAQPFDEFVREADVDASAEGDAYLARLRGKQK